MSSNGKRSNKLKILIALLYYVPHRTGLTIYVQRVAEELARRGHEVTVLTARFDSSTPSDELLNGVHIVRLWTPPVAVSRGVVMPTYPFAALSLMREHDIVWVNVPLLETALLGVLARMTGRPIIATHHGDLSLPEGAINRLITATMLELFKFMARRSARLIANSDDFADHSCYLQPFRDKVTAIYPPIEMPLPNPERVKERRAQWSQDGGPVIGFAGRFVQEKRPDLLIRALEGINRVFPTARIVFAGEYNVKYENTWERNQDIIQQYRGQLIFLGLMTDPQDMADFYAACDVLALTSDAGSESFAMCQVEAMLSGTPVVMTDLPGARVPVRDTEMGRLARPGDWRSIAEAIIDVLQNRDRYVKPRAFVEAKFSFRETVDRYEQVFREYA